MPDINEVQSALLANFLCKHPGLGHEMDQLVSSLTEKEKGDLYERIFRQPVNKPIPPTQVYSPAPVQMPPPAQAYPPAPVSMPPPARVYPSAPATLPPPELENLPMLCEDQIYLTTWPEPNWAVPGLLPVGLVILAGAPKIGKSWLSLQLAHAIATGADFLTGPAQPGNVLVCALEDSPQRLRKRMQAMGWIIDPSAPPKPGQHKVDFLTLAQAQSDHPLQQGGARLAGWIKRKNYQLVVIDTLSRAIPGDQQDVQIMTRQLTPLQEMSHQLNCTIMLCDHHRKAGGMETDPIADILGSTAKGAMADTIWSLYRERGKPGAKLAITGRDVEETTLQLKFDQAACCWLNQGPTTSLEITERRQEILAALTDLGRVTLKELSSHIAQDLSNVHKRLEDLINTGFVKKEKEGGLIYYELAS